MPVNLLKNMLFGRKNLSKKDKFSGIAYWKKRAVSYGGRAVLSVAHSEDVFENVTEWQKEKFFPIFKQQLLGNERIIVDFGCGVGRFTKDLSNFIQGRAIGIDPIKRLIKLAPKGKNVKYKIMREGKIPLPSNFADVIWVHLVMGGIVDDVILKRTVSEIDRVLKKDGIIFLVENTTVQKDEKYWKYRSVEYYKGLFSFVELQNSCDYIDCSERISIMFGRRNLPMSINRGVGTKEYYQKYYAGREWEVYRNILSKVIELSEPGPILDIGTGIGLFVECAARWGFDCIGIDGSSEAIKIGQERCKDISLIHHVLDNPLPFQDGRFTTVIMNQVIEHLEPKIRDIALFESYRVLRPGGALLIYSPNRFNRKEAGLDPTHIVLYSPKELRNLLASRGFQKVVPFNYPSDILGTSKLCRKLSWLLFILMGEERLSATSNCAAYKPKAS